MPHTHCSHYLQGAFNIFVHTAVRLSPDAGACDRTLKNFFIIYVRNMYLYIQHIKSFSNIIFTNWKMNEISG